MHVLPANINLTYNPAVSGLRELSSSELDCVYGGHHCDSARTASNTLLGFGGTVSSLGGAWLLYWGPPDPSDTLAGVVTGFGLVTAGIGGIIGIGASIFCGPAASA